MVDYTQNNKADKPEYCFRLQNITKRFGASIALNNVSLEVKPGEVIGLIGPNGAGKSTLMGILTGVVPATDGKIELNGVEYSKEKYSTVIAKEGGIACCYQELSVCSNLLVYENFAITVMNHKPFGKYGWRKEMIRLAEEMLENVFPGNKINVRMKIGRLPIEQKQMVEVCCAMAQKGMRVLVLDEPTSSLTTDRIQQFHEAIKKLQERKISVIYISHKLEEIIRISSRIVVMRNGVQSGEITTEITTIEDLVNIMGGRINTGRVREHIGSDAEKVLEIAHCTSKSLYDISMYVSRGEVVGISGLGGSGQRELLNEIYRTYQLSGNKAIRTIGKASFVSGDRQNEGIFRLWSIADNIVISSLDLMTKWKLIAEEKSEELAQHWYDKLKFRAQGKEDKITNLSGGNQQKAIIGRGIASEADLIIFDDPTRGVDAETKKDIYDIIKEISKLGKSVIWYSTEDNEMLECDRVYVMRDGTIVDELQGEEISVDAVVASSFKEAKIANAGVDRENSSFGKKVVSALTSGSGISIFVLIVIWIIMSNINQNVNTRTGMTYMIGTALPLVLVSLAQMFIVSVGDINLGIGNAMGVVNVITATILVQKPLMGILAMLGVWGLYIVVAVLIHKRNMPSIVVSLGMLSVWLGIALLILPTPGGSAPTWLSWFFTIHTPFLPIQVYLCVIAAGVGYWLVFRSKYGMVIRGVGDNPASVSKRGWSYLRAHVMAYVISGIFVLLAGITMTYVSRGADANASSSYQMMSIATILLGGCAFSGGIVEPIGVVAGGLSISLISSMLTFLQVDSSYRTAVIGIILVVVLVVGEIMKRRRSR